MSEGICRRRSRTSANRVAAPQVHGSWMDGGVLAALRRKRLTIGRATHTVARGDCGRRPSEEVGMAGPLIPAMVLGLSVVGYGRSLASGVPADLTLGSTGVRCPTGGGGLRDWAPA